MISFKLFYGQILKNLLNIYKMLHEKSRQVRVK